MNPGPAAGLAFLLGLLALLGQTLLARDLLVLVHGSELALGAVLAAWLLLTGLGGFIAGRALARRGEEGTGPAVLLAAAAALGLPAAMLLTRFAVGWIPGAPGAAPDLVAALPVVLAATALAALPGGAWYAAAAGLAGGAAGPGRAYAWEAAGGLAGGIVFTYALAGRADGLLLAAWISAAALLALAGALASGGLRPRPARRRAPIALLALAAGLLLADPLLDLADRSRRARWPGLELAAARDTRYGNLALVRRGTQYTLLESGSPSFSFPDPESAERAAHLPLLAAESVERVLVAGGAVGGVLGETLRHPVREADYLELDPGVIELVRPRLGPRLAAALRDPRARVRSADLRSWLARTPGRYDAILLGVPEPSTALANRFATREFFALVGAALRPGGVAALALPSSPNYLGPELRLRNGSVLRALAEAFPRVEILSTDPLVLLASFSARPLADPERMAGRLAERGLRTTTLSPEVVRAHLDPARASFFRADLEASGAPANRDLAPVAYLFHARYQEAVANPRRARALGRLADRGRWWAFALPALILAAGLGAPAASARGARRALALAAASTGAAVMSLQYLVLFVYQTGRGQLYGRIGILSGAFMGGLALGSWIALRRNRRCAPVRELLRAELLLALLPAATLPLFGALPAVAGGAVPAGADLLAVLLAALCGAAAGFEFPLYALADPEPSGAAAAGGRFYAAELFGSAAGALLVSLWLLPLLGLGWSLALLAALKLASLVLVARAFPAARR